LCFHLVAGPPRRWLAERLTFGSLALAYENWANLPVFHFSEAAFAFRWPSLVSVL
jgi:hypothetical protein